MKFGGTSIRDGSCIQRVIGIIQARLDRSPVLVFSAMGKTTRILLEAARQKAGGNRETAGLLKRDVEESHRKTASELFGDSQTGCRLEPLLEEFSRVFQSIPGNKTLSNQNHDRLISFGERFSTAIMLAALKKAGIPAVELDARRIIQTDSCFTHAKPNMELIRNAIQEQVMPVSSSGTVVTQGFIGSDEKGNTTTLGFEGSDFTAALLGWGADAEEIQIWKDVPGVMTADPLIIRGVKTVRALSYDEAEILTRCGAKVLHPMTMAPAREKKIPVRILDSTNPKSSFTVIGCGDEGGGPVRSIAIQKNMIMARIKVSENDVDRLTQDMPPGTKDTGSPWICCSAKDGTIIVTSSDKWKTADVSGNLSKYTETLYSSMALISLVGTGLKRYRIRQKSVIDLMGPIPVHIICGNISSSARHLLVNEPDAVPVLQRLHECLFCSEDSLNSFFEDAHDQSSACRIRQNGTVDRFPGR